MPKPRLLLADDHTIVLDGLTRLLEPEFEVVGKVGDGRAMLDLAAKLNPDVIIADISMPLLSGMEAVRQLKEKDSRSKVIILSMHADLELAREALCLGASGYVLKHSAAETLCCAIHEVLNGMIYVSPRISIDVLSAIQQTSRSLNGAALTLTQREREVLQLVAEGRTIRGIAQYPRHRLPNGGFSQIQPHGQAGSSNHCRINPLCDSMWFVISSPDRYRFTKGGKNANGDRLRIFSIPRI